ncbi:hypothetical protein PRZ48_010862 [Zasmidium cellare]|uniref:Uncharacterized protein n=1 Tax=Zasmidium cellare TaxID=395010 RepID=A0ABR0EAC7_ZASCE|nr:hypothetical protein PRZ48_010862 [Zasmidium cellare]
MAPDSSSITAGDMQAHQHQEAPSRRPASRISNTQEATTSAVACRLLALPAELREQIWIHTVTEWMPAPSDKQDKHASSSQRSSNILEKKPIRMDRLNRPLPPAITRVSHQLQAETLPLYYQENIFECWRPLFWINDWSVSTLIDWLKSLSNGEINQAKWLRHVVLLYKNQDELEYDVVAALFDELGYELDDCEITSKLELSEYEQCFEQMGLPRHFGKKKRYDRWGAAHT